jgi:Na+/alanine symporter
MKLFKFFGNLANAAWNAIKNEVVPVLGAAVGALIVLAITTVIGWIAISTNLVRFINLQPRDSSSPMIVGVVVVMFAIILGMIASFLWAVFKFLKNIWDKS